MKVITLPGIDEYANRHTSPDSEILLAVADRTNLDMDAPQMMIGQQGARLLQTLVYALGARRVLEIGTFTGYSSLSMASVLPPGGRIISCEANPRHAAIARKNIAASPYADRITVELGAALDTIARLDGPFDFVFIDADKTQYLDYFEAVLPKLGERSLIAADNTLWNGDVMDDSGGDADVDALRRFNKAVAEDPRVVTVLLTVRDGLTLIRPSSANGAGRRVPLL